MFFNLFPVIVTSGTAQENSMWMWFNDALMELENFNRGHKPDKKKQWCFTKQS